MMELVDCDQIYWEFVRELRTNPKNTVWFYTQPNIDSEKQIEYMLKNSKKYKICLLDNNPVGYVGILENNEITYCVHPDYKGLGVGKFMVSEMMKLNDEIIAYVLPTNIISRKVFLKLGFEEQIFYKFKKS